MGIIKKIKSKLTGNNLGWLKKRFALEESEICDFCWFLTEYHRIYEKHGNCTVAIKNKQILCTKKMRFEVLEYMDRNHHGEKYMIQSCTGDEAGYLWADVPHVADWSYHAGLQRFYKSVRKNHTQAGK